MVSDVAALVAEVVAAAASTIKLYFEALAFVVIFAVSIVKPVPATYPVPAFVIAIDVTLPRHQITKQIELSTDILRIDANIHQHPTIDPIQRGLKLYDRLNNRYEFDEDLICTVVYFRPFTELTEPARSYINIKAARVFVDRLVSDDALRTYTEQDETRARAILMETDLANGDHNILRGDPSLTSVFDTYSPANGLIR